MKNPDGDEIWGDGDWWQKRINSKGTKMKYILSPKELKQLTKASEPWYASLIFAGVYVLGFLLYGVITGSYCGAILWPFLLPFHFIF